MRQKKLECYDFKRHSKKNSILSFPTVRPREMTNKTKKSMYKLITYDKESYPGERHIKLVNT